MSRDDRDFSDIERSEQLRVLVYLLSVLDTALRRVRELQRIASQGRAAAA